MSSIAALSVILPTIGRGTLRRTLESCASQLERDDRVFVVADSNQPDLIQDVRDLVWEFGQGFVYLEHDGGFKHWGCPQRNFGIWAAKEGSLLVFQDDTDVFDPDGFRHIRTAYEQYGAVPLLFECDLRGSGSYLDSSREIRCGEVDGHMLVVPNLPGRVADWPYRRYESDFDWIEATLALWPEGSLVRVPELLSICHEKP